MSEAACSQLGQIFIRYSACCLKKDAISLILQWVTEYFGG